MNELTLTKEQIEGMIAECKAGQDPFASGEVDAIAILALATKALDQADALPPDLANIATMSDAYLTSQLKQATTRIKALEAGLNPFAFAARFAEKDEDGRHIGYSITSGDLRHAASLLEKKP